MADDYEIIPIKEIKKLKAEIAKLKKEKTGTPEREIAGSLDRLTVSLEGLFEIFHVAASEIERDRIDEKSFEEKVEPIMDKLHDIEEQNKDIAEGILALADIIKGKKPAEKIRSMGTYSPEPVMPEMEMPEMEMPEEEEEPRPIMPPPRLPPLGNMPPPPPPK